MNISLAANGPNPDEAAYCNPRRFWDFRRLQQCSWARGEAEWSEEMVATHFPGIPDTDDRVNAFRHYLWAGMMAWSMGEGVARKFLDLDEPDCRTMTHEQYVDHVTDEFNNLMAISQVKDRATGIPDSGSVADAQNLILNNALRLINEGRYERRADHEHDRGIEAGC